MSLDFDCCPPESHSVKAELPALFQVPVVFVHQVCHEEGGEAMAAVSGWEESGELVGTLWQNQCVAVDDCVIEPPSRAQCVFWITGDWVGWLARQSNGG